MFYTLSLLYVKDMLSNRYWQVCLCPSVCLPPCAPLNSTLKPVTTAQCFHLGAHGVSSLTCPQSNAWCFPHVFLPPAGFINGGSAFRLAKVKQSQKLSCSQMPHIITLALLSNWLSNTSISSSHHPHLPCVPRHLIFCFNSFLINLPAPSFYFEQSKPIL